VEGGEGGGKSLPHSSQAAFDHFTLRTGRRKKKKRGGGEEEGGGPEAA